MAVSGTQTLCAAAEAFIDNVLALHPRVAAFDCDGTLWSGDVGESFFVWEVEHRIVSPEIAAAMHARYNEYKAGKVFEDDMCAELVTMHSGMTEDSVMSAAADFLASSFPGYIFPEMKELIRRLRQSGCDIWAVSSSNEWVIRVAMKQFGIASNRILASQAELKDGVVTDRIVRVPSGPGKSTALREVARKHIDVAFGNSQWDADMLALAQYAFAVNPKAELEITARERGWTIYFPEGTSSRL